MASLCFQISDVFVIFSLSFQLPECLIGLMQLCYPDPVHAIQAAEFFEGTSPRADDVKVAAS